MSGVSIAQFSPYTIDVCDRDVEIAHAAAEDDAYEGYFIPKGSIVSCGLALGEASGQFLDYDVRLPVGLHL